MPRSVFRVHAVPLASHASPCRRSVCHEHVPYAAGHVSWPAPGDVTGHLEALQRPHGRVHLAGERTTVLRGTMEGALRSGIRAATEVDEVATG